MNAQELKQCLELHLKWLRSEEGGKRADLSGADLSGAYLSGAYLSGADLSGAYLSGAYLYGKKVVRVVSVGGIGSAGRTTLFFICEDCVQVNCGCFLGTLDKFEKKVKETHKDNPQYLKEYQAAIKFFEAVKEAK